MRLAALSIGLVALISACGSDGEGASKAKHAPAGAPKSADRPQASRDHAKEGGPSLGVLRTRYGRILVDGKGKALYLFTADEGKRSRCHGDCAHAWPPFTAKGSPHARGAARPALVGTTTRGGTRQVTYRGQPLYYYVGDRRPGQVLCQAVQEFGGYWYVVAPSGTAIR
jgi:predicted lipoprotein with Yx(FWY)xxD motif